LIELAPVLQDMAKELGSLGLEFAVVGGLAVSVRGTPRFTADADLAVAVESDAEAETVVRQMLSRGYGLKAQIEHRETGRLAIVRLVSPKSHGPNQFIVDLLFASSSLEPQVVAGAQPAEVLPGILLPVARRGHLIAMKVLSMSDKRPQDRVDVLNLAALASAEDMTLARAALASVEAQGLEQGRRLQQELEECIRLAAEPDPTFIPRPLKPTPPA
jgi:hypothetical protein